MKSVYWDVPGGPVVEYLPGSAGNTGLIPAPGRSHTWGELIKPYTTTTEPVL